MNKRRLLKLAAMLEADAKNRNGIMFDLGVWGKPSNGVAFSHRTNDVKVDCGTQACAMGLAAISGAFKRQGLSYYFRRSWFFDGFELWPRLGRSVGLAAASKLFSITREQSRFLFDPIKYPYHQTYGAKGERYVANRIRDFVAGKVAP